MLTQRPTPDSKCVLNITSFLTLSHPLPCLIFAKDIMVTVLLLGGGFINVAIWVGGTGGGFQFFSIFCSVFALLLFVFSWLVHDSLLCLFHCSLFAFFVSGPFN